MRADLASRLEESQKKNPAAGSAREGSAGADKPGTPDDNHLIPQTSLVGVINKRIFRVLSRRPPGSKASSRARDGVSPR